MHIVWFQHSFKCLCHTSLIFLPVLSHVQSLQTLRIISCFGIQVQLDLLGLLEFFRLAPKGGFDASIGALVNQGIIETVGPLVAFTHDLIQEQVRKIALVNGVFSQ